MNIIRPTEKKENKNKNDKNTKGEKEAVDAQSSDDKKQVQPEEGLEQASPQVQRRR